MVSVNVTVAMAPEMLSDIDDAVQNGDFDSRAQYIRLAIRDAPETPFEADGRLTTED